MIGMYDLTMKGIVMTELVFSESTAVEAFDEFKAQLEELRMHNDKLVFDYESPKGQKEARAHITSLKKTKKAIEDKRKEKKEDSIKFQKALDGEAKRYRTEIEKMIDVHQAPLDEVKNREKMRLQIIEDTKAKIDQFLMFTGGIGVLNTALADIESVKIDDETFRDEAEFMRFRLNEAKKSLKLKLSYAEQAEKDRLELQKFKQEQAERERKEAEERRIKEEQERKEKAEKERIEREKREKELAEQREQERLKRLEEQKKIEEEQAKIKAEKARIARENAERQRVLREENERFQAHKREQERKEREQQERLKKEQEKIEAEKKRVEKEKKKMELEKAKKIVASQKKIVITESDSTDSDDFRTYYIKIEDEGKNEIELNIGNLGECPEDCRLERDLDFAYDIRKAFELGYKAGKEGKSVEFKEVDWNDIY